MVAGDECAEKLPLTPGQIQRRHIQVALYALRQSYCSHESGRKESFTANLDPILCVKAPVQSQRHKMLPHVEGL